jgi:hypothetical protein
MRVWSLADPQIEFVFGHVDDALKAELQAFWAMHGDAYRAEMKVFSAASEGVNILLNPSQQPLHRQPGAIARSEGGDIIGIVFVFLREVSDELMIGTHAYFQRMHIVPEARSLKLANQLFQAFLNGFEKATEHRDHRAKALISVNNNPRLKIAYVRRYFTRLGFRLLGDNKYGNEVWTIKLKTVFVF